LRFVRLKAKHQTAADYPHDWRSKGHSVVNVLNHLLLRLLVSSGFQSIRMTPRVDSIETVIIEFLAESFKVGHAEIRKKTGFKTHAITPQLLCPVQEGVYGVGMGRRLLVRVDFAEKAMVAVAVDADFHGRTRIFIITLIFHHLIFLLTEWVDSRGRRRPEWGCKVSSGGTWGIQNLNQHLILGKAHLYGVLKAPSPIWNQPNVGTTRYLQPKSRGQKLAVPLFETLLDFFQFALC
jgi:hypothetical protein